ncbi:MAG: hypothetical protein ACOX1O_02970 [Eggerthellaceae bacterium]|jgi:hypothetical protein
MQKPSAATIYGIRAEAAILLFAVLIVGGLSVTAYAYADESGLSDTSPAESAATTGSTVSLEAPSNGSSATKGSSTDGGSAAATDSSADSDAIRTESSSSSSSTSSSKESSQAAKKKANTARKQKAPKMTHRKLLAILDKTTGSARVKELNTTYRLKKTKAGKRLIAQVKKISRHHRLGVVLIDVRTGQGFSFSAKRKLYSASCLKGPFVASLCKWKPSSWNRSSWAMRQTIVYSNNDTYAQLRRKYGSSTMRKMMRYSRVGSFDARAYYTFVPTRDLAKLWVSNYWYFFKDKNKNSKSCRNLYTHGRESFIYRQMKGKKRVYTKPGWVLASNYKYRSRNDAGIVTAKIHGKKCPYVLAIMSSHYYGKKNLCKLVRDCDAVHADMMRKYLKKYRL